MLKYALITMYSNVHIPTINDYIATSLTDASTSYITLNADPLSPLQSGLEVKQIAHQSIKNRI